MLPFHCREVRYGRRHPGHNPLGLETIDLSPEAAAIPQFILAGSTDRITGTERPYAYFRRYFDRGAPWTFAVQNKTPHCCVINATSTLLRCAGGTVLNAAKTVLDRTEKLNAAKPPHDTLIDVSKLSTPLLRMLHAELAQIQRREVEAAGEAPSPTPGSAQGPPPDDAAR